MKGILFFLGCGLFAVNVFSQQSPDLNNKIAGTSVVMAGTATPDVNINPNPVQGQSFSLELKDLKKGKYHIYMYDETGRRHLVKVMNFEGGSITESLQLPKNAHKGVYILHVTSKTSRFVKKMIVE